MTDVGLGQKITAFGRLRTKQTRDAVKDNHPLMDMLDKTKGIDYATGGRTVLDESLTGQNGTVTWVGETDQVNLQDYPAVDSPEFNWSYLLGSVQISLAERYQNEGQGRFIDIWAKKQEALEGSMMNVFHAGLLSNGTGNSGLQIDGLAAIVPTVPNSGTVGTIDLSDSNAAWFRTQKFDTGSDWTLGSVDSSNVKKFFDKLINRSIKDLMIQATCILAGETHFEAMSDAVGAMQVLQNQSGDAKTGFTGYLIHRGVKIFYGNGANYSGQSALTTTRSYCLCTKPGGFNVVFHKKAEFNMLEPINSRDQAAMSRLMFTMATTRRGAHSQQCTVGFD